VCAVQLKKLVIDVGKLAEGYKTAGQYMQIKVGDSKAGFFAIASAPDSNNQGLVEVLIKDGPPDSTANLLCNISPGTGILTSHVCLAFQSTYSLMQCLHAMHGEAYTMYHNYCIPLLDSIQSKIPMSHNLAILR